MLALSRHGLIAYGKDGSRFVTFVYMKLHGARTV